MYGETFTIECQYCGSQYIEVDEETGQLYCLECGHYIV